MASSLCGGLNASLPNISQRRPRAIQMGTKLYHHALQKSTTYSDPEGVLPEKLPSYYGRFQSGTVSSWQIDSAVRSSLGAWKTPERVIVLPSISLLKKTDSLVKGRWCTYVQCNPFIHSFQIFL